MACQPTQRRVSSSRVVRLGHDGRNVVDAHALGSRCRLLAQGCVGAVLAFAVHAGELGGELRLFGEECRLFGRGWRRHLQQHDLTTQVLGQLQMVEAVALLSQRQGPRRGDLVQASSRSLGVFCDVGLGGPLRVSKVGVELEQLGIGVVDEGAGLRDGGRALGCGLLGKDCSREEGGAEQNDSSGTHAREV